MRKAIAIDFDGCLCTDVFPDIGEPNWPVIYTAKAEQQAGAGLIPLDLPGRPAPPRRYSRL